jgi:hypothetical protein
MSEIKENKNDKSLYKDKTPISDGDKIKKNDDGNVVHEKKSETDLETQKDVNKPLSKSISTEDRIVALEDVLHNVVLLLDNLADQNEFTNSCISAFNKNLKDMNDRLKLIQTHSIKASQLSARTWNKISYNEEQPLVPVPFDDGRYPDQIGLPPIRNLEDINNLSMDQLVDLLQRYENMSLDESRL